MPPEEARKHVIFLAQQRKQVVVLTAYQVLGLTADASDEEIKTRYKQLALVAHPDKYDQKSEDFKKAITSEALQEVFKHVRSAFSILQDERDIYDRGKHQDEKFAVPNQRKPQTPVAPMPRRTTAQMPDYIFINPSVFKEAEVGQGRRTVGVSGDRNMGIDSMYQTLQDLYKRKHRYNATSLFERMFAQECLHFSSTLPGNTGITFHYQGVSLNRELTLESGTEVYKVQVDGDTVTLELQTMVDGETMLDYDQTERSVNLARWDALGNALNQALKPTLETKAAEDAGISAFIGTISDAINQLNTYKKKLDSRQAARETNCQASFTEAVRSGLSFFPGGGFLLATKQKAVQAILDIQLDPYNKDKFILEISKCLNGNDSVGKALRQSELGKIMKPAIDALAELSEVTSTYSAKVG